MALFKFTDSIISDKPIEIYNNGDMKEILLLLTI